MNTTSTSSALANVTGSSMFVVLLTQVLAHWNINLTPEAAVCAASILTAAVHYVVAWLPKPPSTQETKP
jgi:hypothetical protein